MSTPSVLNAAWPAQNMARAYPLADWATRIDLSGAFRLPDDLLVALSFPTGPEVAIDPTRFHLAALAVYANGIGIRIGYSDGAGVTAAATASVPAVGFRPFSSYPLVGVGPFSGSTGALSIGSLAGLGSAPAGRFEFDLAGGALDCDAIRPTLRGVSKIVVVDAGGVETPLDGVVTLRFGANGRASSPAPGEVRFDAISGAGLNAACDCATTSEADAPPIAAINGLPAAADGGFSLVGDACLTVNAAGSTIALRDACSAPCCGCAEQERLDAAIAALLEKVRTLEDFASRIDRGVAEFANVVVASKVNDAGCASC